MAGGQGFKQGMQQARGGRQRGGDGSKMAAKGMKPPTSKAEKMARMANRGGGSGRGGRGGGTRGGARGQRGGGGGRQRHQETDNYKTQGSHLIGGGAWDRQMQRESGAQNNSAATGSYGAANLQNYINVSKSATQGNNNFSIDSANKFTNNTREQSNVNKQQNQGFSANRINNNSNFANAQQNKAFAKNQGFAQNTTNSFVNNAKNHREDNTAKATQFANKTVSKYMDMNRANQSTDVGALDRNIRKAPTIDKAYSDNQGLNTYGDMYSYGRGGLPGYTQPDKPNPIEQPDFEGMSDKYINNIDDYKI